MWFNLISFWFQLWNICLITSNCFIFTLKSVLLFWEVILFITGNIYISIIFHTECITIRNRDMALFVDHIVNIQHIFVSSQSISKVILIIRDVLVLFPIVFCPEQVLKFVNIGNLWLSSLMITRLLWPFFTVIFLHNVFSIYEFSSQCFFELWFFFTMCFQMMITRLLGFVALSSLWLFFTMCFQMMNHHWWWPEKWQNAKQRFCTAL